MSNMSNNYKTYNANCHCGAIRYIVNVSPPLEDGQHEVSSCNCSICARNGTYNIFISKDQVNFVKGQNEMKDYRYLGMIHSFCPTCGTSMMVRMSDPDHDWFNYYALNARTFEGIDVHKLKVKNADMKDVGAKYEI